MLTLWTTFSLNKCLIYGLSKNNCVSLLGSNGSSGTNNVCLNTVLVRSFNVVFLTLSSGTSFHFVITKPVVVISVGKRLLQKFAVWFLLGHFVSSHTCLLSILWSLSTIRENCTTDWNVIKPELGCRNLWCLGHLLHESLTYVSWIPVYPCGSWLHF